MYEIWSLGHKPFEGYTNPEVMLHGVILSKPMMLDSLERQECSMELY